MSLLQFGKDGNTGQGARDVISCRFLSFTADFAIAPHQGEKFKDGAEQVIIRSCMAARQCIGSAFTLCKEPAPAHTFVQALVIEMAVP